MLCYANDVSVGDFVEPLYGTRCGGRLPVSAFSDEINTERQVNTRQGRGIEWRRV